LRLVSESLLVLDSDSVAASQSKWFQARRIACTLTTARESRITNRISFFISVSQPGTNYVRPQERGELNTEAEATETAEVQACGSSQSLRERAHCTPPVKKSQNFYKRIVTSNSSGQIESSRAPRRVGTLSPKPPLNSSLFGLQMVKRRQDQIPRWGGLKHRAAGLETRQLEVESHV